MSASKKLRALLDAAVKEEAGIVPVNPEDLGYVQYNKSQAALEDAIAEALPQIVEVIEAVETFRLPNPAFIPEAYEGEIEQFTESNNKLAAALIALDEALGGDVT